MAEDRGAHEKKGRARHADHDKKSPVPVTFLALTPFPMKCLLILRLIDKSAESPGAVGPYWSNGVLSLNCAATYPTHNTYIIHHMINL